MRLLHCAACPFSLRATAADKRVHAMAQPQKIHDQVLNARSSSKSCVNNTPESRGFDENSFFRATLFGVFQFMFSQRFWFARGPAIFHLSRVHLFIVRDSCVRETSG